MDMKGKHLVIDAYDCIPEVLDDPEKLKTLMLTTLRLLKLEILFAYFHPFSPQGVTGIIAISTSHFTIHTWPEHGYAALDFYTCSMGDGWAAMRKLLEQLGTKRFCMYELTRGIEGQIISNKESTEVRADVPYAAKQGYYAPDWDVLILNQIKKGNNKILFDGASSFHKIFLAEAKNLQLYMNKELQFSSLDEKYYHEALVIPAMEMAKSRERVLIIGGGDGLGLREVLKYDDVNHVDIVDIDDVVLYLAKSEPAFTVLNAGSLMEPRVVIHTMDATRFIKENSDVYDVIIIDLSDPSDASISMLYTMEFYQSVARHLTAGGIIATQAISPKETPKVFWSIAKTLTAAGLQTKPYYNIVPSFGIWGYLLATREGFGEIPSDVTVPHQAIPENLALLFKLPATLKPPKEGLIINSRHNLKLHELFQEEKKLI